jgi:hypothetical protein
VGGRAAIGRNADSSGSYLGATGRVEADEGLIGRGGTEVVPRSPIRREKVWDVIGTTSEAVLGTWLERA